MYKPMYICINVWYSTFCHIYICICIYIYILIYIYIYWRHICIFKYIIHIYNIAKYIPHNDNIIYNMLRYICIYVHTYTSQQKISKEFAVGKTQCHLVQTQTKAGVGWLPSQVYQNKTQEKQNQNKTNRTTQDDDDDNSNCNSHNSGHSNSINNCCVHLYMNRCDVVVLCWSPVRESILTAPKCLKHWWDLMSIFDDMFPVDVKHLTYSVFTHRTFLFMSCQSGQA